MRVPVSEAKGQLTELVKRAEAGDDELLLHLPYMRSSTGKGYTS